MLLLQLTINGLAAGALYALMAVGFAIIYNGTRILHLAHGAAFTFGGYMLYVLVSGLKMPILVAFPLAVLATAALGVLMDVFVYRPLRAKDSSNDAVLIASIGLLTLLQAIYALVFGTETRNLRHDPMPSFEIGEIIVTEFHIIAALVAVVLFTLLQVFLTRSRYGRAIRALADNPKLAVVIGIDTDRLYMLLFALGSGLAAVAMGLMAFDTGIRPQMGFSVMVLILVAVIVGGIGYLPGAAAGGVLLGVLQHVSLWQLSAGWQDVVVFGALILFLLLRPQGIFGHLLATRRA